MKIRICLLLAMIMLCAGCPDSGNTSNTSNFDAEWEKRTLTQMNDYDRQTKRVDEQQAKMDEQNKRFDKLLDKWEAQSARYDAILDAMEKQHRLEK